MRCLVSVQGVRTARNQHSDQEPEPPAPCCEAVPKPVLSYYLPPAVTSFKWVWTFYQWNPGNYRSAQHCAPRPVLVVRGGSAAGSFLAAWKYDLYRYTAEENSYCTPFHLKLEIIFNYFRRY